METKHLKRIFILVAAVFIKICVGSLYSWSVYSHILIKDYSFTSFQSQIVFGLSVLTFTFTMLYAGRLEKKFGPSIISFTGGIFFILGHLLANLSKGNFQLIAIGMGILTGIGIGCCYVAALVTPIKWFLHSKGFVSGITVAGFGFGAVVHSFLVQKLKMLGIDLFNIFLIVGISYGLVIILASLMLAVPEGISKNFHNSIVTIRDLVKDKNIIILSIAMFIGTFCGLMVIGNIKFIAMFYGVNESIALLTVSLFSISNASGRIIWGFFADKINRKRLIQYGIIISIFSMALAPVFFKYQLTTILISLLFGFGFASNFVLFVSEVSYRYGVHKVSSIYPYIFFSYGFAGILAPSFGGFIFDLTKTYNYAIIFSIILSTVGLILFTKYYITT